MNDDVDDHDNNGDQDATKTPTVMDSLLMWSSVMLSLMWRSQVVSSSSWDPRKLPRSNGNEITVAMHNRFSVLSKNVSSVDNYNKVKEKHPLPIFLSNVNNHELIC